MVFSPPPPSQCWNLGHTPDKLTLALPTLLGGGGVRITIQFFLQKTDYAGTCKRWFHFLKSLRIFFPGPYALRATGRL